MIKRYTIDDLNKINDKKYTLETIYGSVRLLFVESKYISPALWGWYFLVKEPARCERCLTLSDAIDTLNAWHIQARAINWFGFANYGDC